MLFSFLAEGAIEKRLQRIWVRDDHFLSLSSSSFVMSLLIFLDYFPSSAKFFPSQSRVPQQCLSVHKGGRRDMTTKRFVCF